MNAESIKPNKVQGISSLSSGYVKTTLAAGHQTNVRVCLLRFPVYAEYNDVGHKKKITRGLILSAPLFLNACVTRALGPPDLRAGFN